MLDFLIRMLFEDLVLLFLVEVVIVAIALAIHRRYGTRRTRTGWWVVVAACLAQIGIQRLVVTDREAIKDLVHTLAVAVDDGDMAMLAEHFDDGVVIKEGYFGSLAGKEAVIARAHVVLQQNTVKRVRVGGYRIEVLGDLAKVICQVMADIRMGGATGSQRVPSRWDLEVVRTPGGWKLRRAAGEFGLGHFGA
ncbi:MAG TPA: nuclear transport factor 2 family protein [Phycisphaerae bacterium]|nr:nuclear transport factor 2 family protein [Phycisphaerae bacterium]HRY67517.1 nuclear transport factor 2 family protein [Phycisphaerae bacterium]HSA24904.1 nuclear transport factor 2 family protein [Phycisphaerae bacterium]